MMMLVDAVEGGMGWQSRRRRMDGENNISAGFLLEGNQMLLFIRGRLLCCGASRADELNVLDCITSSSSLYSFVNFFFFFWFLWPWVVRFLKIFIFISFSLLPLLRFEKKSADSRENPGIFRKSDKHTSVYQSRVRNRQSNSQCLHLVRGFPF